MTLIVGILCQDGIVLGADGAATLGSIEGYTVRQPTSHKLAVVSGKAIVGVSGPIGLGQRYRAAVEALWTGGKFSGQTPVEAGVTLRKAFWPDLEMELRASDVAAKVLGRAATASSIATAVVALPLKHKPALLQFDSQAAPEVATDDLPFVAIGSGQRIADPFLAFVRRVLWKGPPSLKEGLFAACWTLQHAIDTNPGGVALPKQLVVLETSGSDLHARELAQDETGELEEGSGALEAALLGAWNAVVGKADSPGEAPPPVPQPRP